MKTKLYIAVLASMLFASCTEDIYIENIVLKNKNTLNVEVTDEFAAAVTRANYTGFPATTFEEGDAIGVYVFDGSSYVVSNTRFVKQSDGSWLSDEDIPYEDGQTFYAYYPYRSIVYTPSTSGTLDAVDSRFASFISDTSNYFWCEDQSTKVNFTYSNLMISKGTITDTDDGSVTVKFTMKHKRGLAVLNGDAADEYYSGNIPYNIEDNMYFLLKPSTETTIGGYNLSAPEGKYVSRTITIDYSTRYLTFKALETGTFTLTIPSGVTTTNLTSVSYSIDGGNTWVTSPNSSSTVTITTPTVPAGKKVLWKGIGTTYANSLSAYSSFSSTCSFVTSGNIMSLLYDDSYSEQVSLANKNNAFTYLFRNCSKIISVKNLILPATTLANYCYQYMFNGCTSLTTAPELPATTLANNCYNSMFNGCKSLTTAPELPATTLATYCYNGMFNGCTSLTTAPELPATTLANNCYNRMFNGCTSLNYIKAAFLTTPGSGYTNEWLSKVKSTGTFYKNSAATWTTTGVNGVPSGWTVQTYTP